MGLCSIRECPRCHRDVWRENAVDHQEEPPARVHTWSCIHCGCVAYGAGRGKTFIPWPPGENT